MSAQNVILRRHLRRRRKMAQNAVISGIKALLAKQKRPIYPRAALITSPFDPGGWSVAVSAFLFKQHFRFFQILRNLGA
jgi:hypothetical protein